MFSKTVTQTDNFLNMPLSAQALYFHLGMEADDDGFITPLKIMRMIGSMPDDLNILIAKSFLIAFEDGVIVIKDWKINNEIRLDRYKETQFINHKSRLSANNNEYSLVIPVVVPTANQMDTQVRLGKDRLGKVRIDNNTHTHSTLESVNDESIFQELADKYKTNINVVRNAYDNLENYVGSKSNRRYDNYKKALANFVKGDLEKIAKVNSYQGGKNVRPNIAFINPE